MATNIVIGIGGTGARCIEALLHLCAAGMGPDHLGIAFIDQDVSNGNLIARTMRTMKCYADCRTALSRSEPETLLFHSDVSQLMPPPGVWQPVLGEDATLENFFSPVEGQAPELLAALFSEKERKTPIKDGFGGRPALGSLVIAATQNVQAWQDLTRELTRDLNAGNSVRIFLFGSIFGGTGASGFPTAATLLHNAAGAESRRPLLTLGGCLLLPYFTFVQDDQDEQMVADPDAFLDQAAKALPAYGNLFGVIIDALYLVGWTPLLNLSAAKIDAGGQHQTNPPLLPELYAALAAIDFFAANQPVGGTFVTARQGREVEGKDGHVAVGDIEWGAANFPRQDSLGNALARLTRFACAFCFTYAPSIRAAVKTPSCLDARQAWFRRLTHLPAEAAAIFREDGSVGAMKQYCEFYLRWIATLQHASCADANSVRLVDASSFANIAAKPPWEDGLLPLRDQNDANLDRFDEEILPGFGKRSLADIYERVSLAKPQRKVTKDDGIAPLVKALFAAC